MHATRNPLCPKKATDRSGQSVYVKNGFSLSVRSSSAVSSACFDLASAPAAGGNLRVELDVDAGSPVTLISDSLSPSSPSLTITGSGEATIRVCPVPSALAALRLTRTRRRRSDRTQVADMQMMMDSQADLKWVPSSPRTMVSALKVSGKLFHT